MIRGKVGQGGYEILGILCGEVQMMVSQAKGTPIARLSVVLGPDQLETREEAMQVVVFGGPAEKLAGLKEGQRLRVSGRLKENTWNGRTCWEIHVYASKGYVRVLLPESPELFTGDRIRVANQVWKVVCARPEHGDLLAVTEELHPDLLRITPEMSYERLVPDEA